MKAGAAFLLAASLLAMVAARGPDRDYQVRVGDGVYRVSHSGDYVEVRKRALFALGSAKLRDAMRRAAEQATGCTVTAGELSGNVYQAHLACRAD